MSINIKYYNPQLEDKNYLANGLDLFYFLNRTYLMKKKYLKYLDEKIKLNYSELDIFQNIITNKKYLIKKIDLNNYITFNRFPYSNPFSCKHLIFWTLNNLTHQNVLNHLIQLNIIDTNTEFIIWQNSLKSRSIKSIMHYQILIRQKILLFIKQPMIKQPIIKQPIIKKPIIKQKYLKKIIIIARHGPREPIHQLKNLNGFNNLASVIKTTPFDVNYITDAKLTLEGLKFCNNYGKYIKTLFNSYFSFDKTKTVIMSSNVNRTINSAIQFINGLFCDDMTAVSTKISDIILSDDLLGDIKLYRSTELDNLVDTVDYKTFHKNMILTSRSDFFDKQIEEILGSKITSVNDYFNIHSTLKVYKFHKKIIPKEWTEDLDKQLDDCASEYYYKLFYKTKFCNLFTQELLNKVKLLISDTTINFAYLSTHDVVIYPLAIRLSGEEVHLPDFCASIRFEIWTDEVRIYYDDILICNKLL